MPRNPVDLSALVRGKLESTVSALAEGEPVALPHIVLPSLHDLTLQIVPPPPVAVADIVWLFEELRRSHATRTPRTPGEGLAVGDEAILDCVAYHEGRVVPFSVRGAAPYALIEDGEWPGFANMLLEARVGEALHFRLPLPAGEGIPDAWQGVVVDIACTIREAWALQIPASDDPAFLRQTGLGESVEAVLEALTAIQLAEWDARLDHAIARQVQRHVMQESQRISPWEVPEALVNAEIRANFQRTEGAVLRRWGLSGEEQLQALDGWLQDDATRDEARFRVGCALVLGTLVREEGIEADDADVRAHILGLLGNDEATPGGLESDPAGTDLDLREIPESELSRLRESALRALALEELIARVPFDVPPAQRVVDDERAEGDDDALYEYPLADFSGEGEPLVE